MESTHNFKQEIKKELINCYPSLQIGNLEKKRPLLFQNLNLLADTEKKPVTQLMEEWGFDTKIFQLEILKSEIRNKYPNEIINDGMARLDVKVKEALQVYSKQNEMELPDFLCALGFMVGDSDFRNLLISLEQCYPDKKVTSLKKQYPLLYKALNKRAFHNHMDMADFLKQNGFTYIKRNHKKTNTNASVSELLLSVYPDKQVIGLSLKHQDIYHKVRRLAVQSNLSVNDFLRTIGFSPPVEREGILEEEMFERLDTLFPDKVIRDLVTVDIQLYRQLASKAQRKQVPVKEFIESKGFEYQVVSKKGIGMSKKEVLSKLRLMYPDNKVLSLSVDNISLYQKVSKYAKRENKTYQDFLQENGFHTKMSLKKKYSTEEELVQALQTEFPNNICERFYLKSPDLLREVKRYASQNSVTIASYLRSLGFEYKKRSKMKEIHSEEELLELLLQAFPDKKTTPLLKNHRELYYISNRFARKNLKTLTHYLEKFGFEKSTDVI